ncbi:surface antigen-domain-containing protein [Gongronella butleri]|nr:surface antigen-domain-containing protein [Gongronella butleri]
MEEATADTFAAKQQQERAQRLFNILNASAGSPGHVNSISILGTRHTRPGFLETATEEVLKSKTVADVINSSQTVAEKLVMLGIFDDVQILLDKASDHDPLAAPDSINVVYQVKEKNRFMIKTGTEIGNNEGTMNGSLTIRNVFGGGETLDTVTSFGNRTSQAFQFILSSPVRASPYTRVDVNAHHVLRNNKLYSSYEELSRGAGLRYKTMSKFGYHELGYDCTWRSIDHVTPTASLSIRDQAGHSLKSSLQHLFVHDARDHKLVPTRGHYFRVSQELAGVLGVGNAQFFKTEVDAQVCRSVGGGQLLHDGSNHFALHPGYTLSLRVRAGWLADLAEKGSTVSDKYLLGGPLSVRGFKTAGIGPRDYKDALGGDAYWSVGVSAIAPIPRYETKPLRLHAFVNAGSSIPWSWGMGARATADALTRSPSTSAGVGLIYHHGDLARLELNFCAPLTAARGDQVHRGFQFGIGVDFL